MARHPRITFKSRSATVETPGKLKVIGDLTIRGVTKPVTEYRAEAFLALNRLDDARQAYLDLFAADRKQADVLLVAMKNWVAARKANAAGVAPDAIAGFETWRA